MSVVSIIRGKNHKSLFYRVTHQQKKPPMPLLCLETFLTTLFYMFWIPVKVVFYLLTLMTGGMAVAGITGIAKVQQLEIYFDFFPDIVKACYICLIIIGIIYFIFSWKMYIPGLLICTLVWGCSEYIFNKYYPMYQEYDSFASELVSGSSPSDFKINESSKIFDVNGKLIANLKENADLKYLDYEDIPKDVVNAFVAVEDRSFWKNEGVDYKGILTAAYEYVKSHGNNERGASTITQQLTRNVYLTHEVSIERKLKEILISRHLTKKYSKEQIMEFYVNDINYGNGIYGIAGAARAYFDKNADELTLAEAAYLCALPNRPSYFNPYNDPEKAVTRRNKILKDMKDCGYITEDTYEDAIQQEVVICKPKETFNNYMTTFAVDSVIKYFLKLDNFTFRYTFDNVPDYQEYKKAYNEAYERERHRLYTGGYRIYTTLNLSTYNQMQAFLDENLSFDEEVDEETGVYALQGAATIIDNSTGKVVAIVGGRSQDSTSYGLNRAYQSTRQPGSSIKPIAVYTPALMKGWTADTVVENIDVTAAKEKGVDVQALTGEQMTLRQAVEKSRNGVAWKIFDAITPQYGLSFPVAMQYSSIVPTDYYNAASLGGLTYGVTTVEQASGYATLANHGIYREPTCIVSIRNRKGDELYEEYAQKIIYSASAADDMVDILKGVLTAGTATGLKWYSDTETEAFCKTGTTNKSKDGWLCGATPYYSIAVWVGYDQPRELSNLYGATYPGQIWRDMMKWLISERDTAKFERVLYDENGDEIDKENTGYYSYLEGRDDSEVLSGDYTVGDYRTDRVIGESLAEVINELNALDMASPEATEKANELYARGQAIIETIYSRKYAEETTADLNNAYQSKVGAGLPQDSEQITEAITSSPDFDAAAYAARYPDLGAAGITTPEQLYEHWITHGKAEGRNASK